MKWLWFVGPLVVLLVAWLVGLQPTAEERRLRRIVQRWLEEYLGPLRSPSSMRRTGKVKSRRVRQLPTIFRRVLDLVGGGVRMTDAVLVPKLAYVAVRLADLRTSFNHVTVLCRLSKAAPSLVCRPLPVVDGRPVENSGVAFKKHTDFTDLFLVEGDDEKAVRRWLRRSLRDALLELPEVWLRVEGDVMAVTLYGAVDEELLDELVGVADAFFAEHGAGGGQSLFPESVPEVEDEESEEPLLEPASAGLRLRAGAIDVGLYVVAAFLLAAMHGAFERFHPSVLFTSPDFQVSEPWQGGWTTKGFAAFLAAETFLTGLIVYQAYLGASRGQSIGKLLLGAKVERGDGKPTGFVRGVLLRTWILALIPLGVAAYMAHRSDGFGARSVIAHIVTMPTLVAAVAVVMVAAASLFASKERRALQDLLSGTRVVATEPFQLQPLQLGVTGADPEVTRRALRGGAIVILFVVANAIAYAMGLDFWIY